MIGQFISTRHSPACGRDRSACRPSHGTDPTFAGTVDLVEHLGEVQILYLDLNGAREKFLVKVDGERAFSRTQSVNFTARRRDVHIFDNAGRAVRS
ncbi:TOBE domain-containing protein [Ensifer adhaerens]|uniref:TOBE domain-containing protein n=1 Tax=Ensifer adhaerens TaxID=106592 RepID=UPI002285D954|nr:TOBE domain-containing protein [Ensifer adhaerens]MDF8356543.1 TOBE domain-containing protein [Ensifer adhaerens]